MDAKYNRDYYHNNVDKTRKIARQAERRKETKQFIWDYLHRNPCVDCSESDPIVLEFDHVRGVKEKAIAETVNSGWGLEKIKAEISKCDVRCANCHRRKTYSQFNYAVYEASSDSTYLTEHTKVGVIWITNGIEGRKIKGNTPIPEGWRKGRRK